MIISAVGVLPVPPTVMFPTQMIGVENFSLFSNPQSNIQWRILTTMR